MKLSGEMLWEFLKKEAELDLTSRIRCRKCFSAHLLVNVYVDGRTQSGTCFQGHLVGNLWSRELWPMPTSGSGVFITILGPWTPLAVW